MAAIYGAEQVDRWAAVQRLLPRGRAGWLVLPALLFIALIYLYPLGYVFWLSVGGSELTLKHFAGFFDDPALLKVMANTFELAFTTTVICLLLGYPVAYLLVRLPRSWRMPLLLTVVVPYLTSFLVRTYAWVVLLNDNGLVNDALQWLGLTDEPVKLLYNRIGVHVGMVHVMLPLMVLPLYSVMDAIDGRLERAAASMGAGAWRTFFRVFLPLSLPGVRSGCLLVFLISLGFYITPVMLGGLGDRMLVNLIDAQVTRLGNWSFGAAASVVLLVVTLAGLFLIAKLAGGGDVFELGQSNTILRAAGTGRRPPLARLWRTLGRTRPAVAVADSLARWRARRWEAAVSHGGAALPIGRWGLRTFVALILLFLILPTLVVVPISFSSASLLTFPPPGWSLRWYETFFTKRGWVDGSLLSLKVGGITMVFATVLGTLAAYGLVRSRMHFKRTIMNVVVSPIIVPPIVIGVGLYGLFVGWGLRGTWYGLVLAHSIGALAFVVVIVSATLSRFDFTLERAALSLGASPARTFRKVTLPLIRPGLVAAAVFAFLHSFDELVISMLISGVQGKTLPPRMWENIRNEIDPTIAAVSTLMLGLSLLSLVILTFTRRGAQSRPPSLPA